jgi:acetyl-CoA C-acetyltransferase
MSHAYIFDAVRTPRGRGKPGGSLHTIRPVELLSGVLEALRDRNDLDTAQVEDVLAGCVTQTGEQGACIARWAALGAGYDEAAPGATVNRFCASGLEAVNIGAAKVAAGFSDLVISGGVESMSRVPMGSDGGPMWDAQMQWDVGSVPQGISADLLATTRGFSRAAVDEFAATSQARAAAAIEAGAFGRSIVPVKDRNGLLLLDHDEHPRPGTTAEKLGGLKASFEMIGKQFGLDALTRRKYPHVEAIEHVHTAGNSSGIVDGASALLIGSLEKGQSMGLTPRARIRAVAACGSEPVIMLDGPIPASRRALKKAGMEVGDIDLFEVNEAFAAVPMAFMQSLDVDPSKVNVNGGAIALGHPLGATGAILLGTVIDALEDRDLNTGLVTLCIGGGMGVTTIVERVAA